MLSKSEDNCKQPWVLQPKPSEARPQLVFRNTVLNTRNFTPKSEQKAEELYKLWPAKTCASHGNTIISRTWIYIKTVLFGGK